MIYIGDAHCKIQLFSHIVSGLGSQEFVQIGDFGFKEEHDWFISQKYNGKILFGNHDYFPYLYMSHSMQRWTTVNNVLYIAGAESIDKRLRIEGISYFESELISITETYSILDAIDGKNIEGIVTHDAPQFVAKSYYGIVNSNIQRQFYDILFENCRPSFWVYGHHHQHKRFSELGCHFFGLGELEVLHI